MIVQAISRRASLLLLVLIASLATATQAGCGSAQRANDKRSTERAAASAAATATASAAAAAEPRCALIGTDDDIPSGSATAGALYVENAELGRKLLTADVVAVARGFIDGGISCVEVLDSHDGAIDPAPLEAIGVPLLTPSNREDWTWPFLGPMRRRYAMAALVGYHARAGGDGFRTHTVNDAIRLLRINNRTVGEVTHLVVGLAAFGVPVVLVSGGSGATGEAAALLPEVERVTVRWREPDGSTGFLSQQQAASQLHAAAKRAAGRRVEAYRPKLPLRLEIATYSRGLMRDRWGKLAGQFRGYVEQKRAPLQAHPLGDKLDVGVLDSATLSPDGRLSWKAGNELSAFVSVAAAAWLLRGPGNFEIVSKGYRAYKSGRYTDALAAYREALTKNPYDVATRCRIAAAHQKMGQLEQAREGFRYGYDRMNELGDMLKVWCARGLAELALADGNRSSARRAALQLMALPDVRDSHREALGWLEQAGGKKRMSWAGGLEGFYPVEALTAALVRRRALPPAAKEAQRLMARVGKLVLARGERNRPEAELVAEHRAYCDKPHERAFNAAKCRALEERRCQGKSCSYQDYANCSGLLLEPGALLTAGHCTAQLASSEALRAASRIVFYAKTSAGWRATEHVPTEVLPLKQTWDQDWVVPRPGKRDHMDVALVRFKAKGAPLPRMAAAATPAKGAGLFVLGFPRSESRPQASMDALGYDHIRGEPAASFGRTVEPNAAGAPLCSITGRQDDWRIAKSCPSGQGRDEKGNATPLGLITSGPFLSNADTINGYSGAPVFDASGSWIGIQVTVVGADPRKGYSRAARAVHLKSIAVLDALIDAGVIAR